MWSHGVVVHPPLLDQDLGFEERVEHLHVEQLVPQLAVEALDIEQIAVVSSRISYSRRRAI